VTIHVTLRSVCDLTNRNVQRGLGVSRDEITGDTAKSLELCRTIAGWARAHRYGAILSPSAALAKARNLNIYIDTRPAEIQLRSGPHREALNY
jgi:RES domain-containing protein